MRHGTIRVYNLGCRCPECKKASDHYLKEHRKKRDKRIAEKDVFTTENGMQLKLVFSLPRQERQAEINLCNTSLHLRKDTK